jgi:hypothetical protein
MLTIDAIAFFGTKAAIAKALGISKQAINEWDDVVPEGRAYQLEVVTNGALKACPHHYSQHQNLNTRVAAQ